MLKIAEYNQITGEKIDLKELEKFGFKKIKDDWKYLGHKTIYFYRESNKKIKKEIHTELIIVNRYREIAINTDIKEFPKEKVYGYGAYISDLNIIYDLIKANFVEVEEE